VSVVVYGHMGAYVCESRYALDTHTVKAT